MDTADTRRALADERRRLESLRGDLQDDVGLPAEDEQTNLSALSSADQHPADTGTETFDRARDLSALEQVEAELGDVEHALDRLAEGTYGVCEACGRDIGEERLRAQPAARFCLDDQRTAEAEAAAGR